MKGIFFVPIFVKYFLIYFIKMICWILDKILDKSDKNTQYPIVTAFQILREAI